MLRQISLAKLGLVAGGILTIIGFVAYFLDNATLNLVGFFYGIPVLLGGLALKAAELEPVPLVQPTPEAVAALRDTQATATQKQILNDVTRYRYGQRAHLDSSLEALGLAPTDEERPVITGVREGETAGNYTLVLEFDSPMMPFDVWQKKQEKLATFFGPGIRVELEQPQEERVNLALITTSQASS